MAILLSSKKNLDYLRCVLTLVVIMLSKEPVVAQIKLNIPGVPSRQQPARQTPNRIPDRPDIQKECPPYVQWATQLSSHYPQADLSRMTPENIEKIAVPLFEDSAFQPFFQISYKDLTPQDLDNILHQKIIPCNASTFRAQIPWATSTLTDAFNSRAGSHALSPRNLILSLKSLDTSRLDLAEKRKVLESLPADAPGFDRAISIQETSSQSLAAIWPDERSEFDSTVHAALVRASGAAFVDRIRPLLEAQPSTSNLQALKSAPDRFANIWRLLESNQKNQFQKRIDSSYQAGLSKMLSEERIQSQKFRADPEGLHEGSDWFQTFQLNYLAQGQNIEANSIADSYLKRRQTQLNTLAPQLRREILNANGDATVDAKIMSVFSLKSDLESSTYRSLYALVSEREVAAANLARDVAKAPKSATVRTPLKTVPEPSKLDNAASAMNVPGLLEKLYAGDLDRIPDDRNTRDYFVSLFRGINDSCPNWTGVPAMNSKAQQTVMYYAFYERTMNLESLNQATGLGGFSTSGDQAYRNGRSFDALLTMYSVADKQHFFESWEADGAKFIAVNKCDSPQTTRLLTNLSKVVGERSLIPPGPPDNNTLLSESSPNAKHEHAYDDEFSTLSLQLYRRCEAKLQGFDKLCRCYSVMLPMSIEHDKLKGLEDFNDSIWAFAKANPGFAAKQQMCAKIAY